MKANYEDKIPQATSEVNLGNLYDVNNNLVNSDFSSGIYSGEKKYFRCTFLDFEIKKVECELDFCDNIYILNSEVK